MFISLASAVLFFSVASVVLGWTSVKFWFEQVKPFLANLKGWMVGGRAVGFLISTPVESIL